ncbi:hypothetical protein CFC21_067276, partial [Triticum aestivum]
MFWHKEPDIKYYMCTINKTFAKPGHGMIQYTKDNLLDYIDPNNDTLMVRLADARLRIECRIMLGTDKRATITTRWSEFVAVPTFAKETSVLSILGSLQSAACSYRALPLDPPSKTPQFMC